jgi:hypothetical protein
MKKPQVRSRLQNLLKWVDGNVKKEGGKGVALSEATTMTDVFTGDSIKKNPRRGRGKKCH